MNKQAIKILAHRGGPERAQENTLSAFKRAIDDGADGFECDVVLTKDGEPVCIHKSFYSDSIAKLVDQKGRLKDIDWATLKTLRTNGKRIPHLSDTMDFVSSHKAECFIEPKVVSDEIIEKIADVVNRHGVQDTVRLITFFHRRSLLCKSKQLNPAITTSVMLISPFGSWQQKAEGACADIIVPGWKGIGSWKTLNHLRLLGALFVDLRKKVNEAQSNNLPVYSGIANDEDNLRWLSDLGVNGIFTDDVPLATRVLSHSWAYGPESV